MCQLPIISVFIFYISRLKLLDQVHSLGVLTSKLLIPSYFYEVTSLYSLRIITNMCNKSNIRYWDLTVTNVSCRTWLVESDVSLLQLMWSAANAGVSWTSMFANQVPGCIWNFCSGGGGTTKPKNTYLKFVYMHFYYVFTSRKNILEDLKPPKLFLWGLDHIIQ